jgi:hypothetical protein
VGANGHGAGDVVDVLNGVPQPSSVVPGSNVVYSIDCPAGAACWALGSASRNNGALLAVLDQRGAVVKSQVVKVPAGVAFAHISCQSGYACQLVGNNGSLRNTLEVAQWDGSQLGLLREVPVGRGISSPAFTGVSCAVQCVAVGTGTEGKRHVGFVLDLTNWLPGPLRVVPTSLSSVSCTSKDLCYATGNNGPDGIVLTINRGSPGPSTVVRSYNLFGITCHEDTCMAAGDRPGKRTSQEGALVALSAGRVTSVQLVPTSAGFTSVAVAWTGKVFAAVGAARAGGSEVTTGTDTGMAQYLTPL